MQQRAWLSIAIACIACVACGHAASSVDGSATVGDDLGGVADPRDLAIADTRDLASAQTPFVYVSGYSTTIARYTLNASTGALTAMGTTTATGTPSFLAF